MLPLPYSGDIELLADMYKDLEALRLELNEEEEHEPVEQEEEDLWPWEEAE